MTDRKKANGASQGVKRQSGECVCVWMHDGKWASDRDIGPFFCPSSEGIIIFCIFIYANTTWIISLSTFLSLSPKVSSLITAQQLAGSIFIINYLRFLWCQRSCITYSRVRAQLLGVFSESAVPMLMQRYMFVLCMSAWGCGVRRFQNKRASGYAPSRQNHTCSQKYKQIKRTCQDKNMHTD